MTSGGLARGSALEPGDSLLFRAVWYYYNDGSTQSEVATALGTSRASVGRMLERARQDGLVKILIAPELSERFTGAAQLANAYGLREAYVVPSGPGGDEGTAEALIRRLANGGAQFLANRLRPGETLAVGWSDTVSRTLLALNRELVDRLRIVTLTGGVDPYLRDYVEGATGSRNGGQPISNMVPAPMLASSPSLAAALMSEGVVRAALEEAAAADHALIGIGAPSANATISKLGYQSAAELEALAKAGAVGDLLGRFYDASGRLIDAPVHNLVIGTGLDDLSRMRNVIAIAGGPEKVAAIHGALLGRYFDTLVTDERTAAQLLRRAKIEADRTN